MNQERDLARTHIAPSAPGYDDELAPGRGSRSSRMEAPSHPIASGLLQRKVRDANVQLSPQQLASARQANPYWHKKLGFDPGAFGSGDPKSDAFAQAVAAYQAKHGLVVDGIASHETCTHKGCLPTGAPNATPPVPMTRGRTTNGSGDGNGPEIESQLSPEAQTKLSRMGPGNTPHASSSRNDHDDGLAIEPQLSATAWPKLSPISGGNAPHALSSDGFRRDERDSVHGSKPEIESVVSPERLARQSAQRGGGAPRTASVERPSYHDGARAVAAGPVTDHAVDNGGELAIESVVSPEGLARLSSQRQGDAPRAASDERDSDGGGLAIEPVVSPGGLARLSAQERSDAPRAAPGERGDDGGKTDHAIRAGASRRVDDENGLQIEPVVSARALAARGGLAIEVQAPPAAQPGGRLPIDEQPSRERLQAPDLTPHGMAPASVPPGSLAAVDDRRAASGPFVEASLPAGRSSTGAPTAATLTGHPTDDHGAVAAPTVGPDEILMRSPDHVGPSGSGDRTRLAPDEAGPGPALRSDLSASGLAPPNLAAAARGTVGQPIAIPPHEPHHPGDPSLSRDRAAVVPPAKLDPRATVADPGRDAATHGGLADHPDDRALHLPLRLQQHHAAGPATNAKTTEEAAANQELSQALQDGMRRATPASAQEQIRRVQRAGVQKKQAVEARAADEVQQEARAAHAGKQDLSKAGLEQVGQTRAQGAAAAGKAKAGGAARGAAKKATLASLKQKVQDEGHKQVDKLKQDVEKQKADLGKKFASDQQKLEAEAKKQEQQLVSELGKKSAEVDHQIAQKKQDLHKQAESKQRDADAHTHAEQSSLRADAEREARRLADEARKHHDETIQRGQAEARQIRARGDAEAQAARQDGEHQAQAAAAHSGAGSGSDGDAAKARSDGQNQAAAARAAAAARSAQIKQRSEADATAAENKARDEGDKIVREGERAGEAARRNAAGRCQELDTKLIATKAQLTRDLAEGEARLVTERERLRHDLEAKKTEALAKIKKTVDEGKTKLDAQRKEAIATLEKTETDAAQKIKARCDDELKRLAGASDKELAALEKEVAGLCTQIEHTVADAEKQIAETVKQAENKAAAETDARIKAVQDDGHKAVAAVDQLVAANVAKIEKAHLGPPTAAEKAEATAKDAEDNKRAHAAETSADALFKAMDGLGTDEKAIHTALAGKSPEELAAIKDAYKKKTGKDLTAELENELSGTDLKEAKAELSGDKVQQAVAALENAKSGFLGFGGDPDKIKSTLASLDPETRAKVAAEYEKQTGVKLKNMLSDELPKGEAAKLDIADPAKPEADATKSKMKAEDVDAAAQKLFHAMDGLGTDEKAIHEALAGKSPEDIAAIKAMYAKHHPEHDLDRDLEDELSGTDLKEAKAQLSGDKTQAAVAALQNAADGLGTDEKKIHDTLEAITDPAERKKVAEEYEKQTGQTLDHMLEDELSGNDKDLAKAMLIEDPKARAAAIGAVKLDQAADGGFLNEMSDGIADTVGVDRKTMRTITAGAAGLALAGVTGGASLIIMAAAKGDLSGTDEEGIYKVLEQAKTPAERKALAEAYKARTGVSLDEMIDKEFSGAEKDVATKLAEGNTVAANAARMKAAAEGLGTDEKAIYAQLEKCKTPDERKALIAEYNKMYGKGPDGESFDQMLHSEMEGMDLQKAEMLQRDHVDPKEKAAFDLEYAMSGIGTDSAAIREVLKGKSKAEIQEIEQAYFAKYKPKTLRNELLGDGSFLSGEVSGRDGHEIGQMLKGKPETPEEIRQRAREDWEFERGSGSNWFSNAVTDLLSDEGKELDRTHREMESLGAKLDAGEKLTEDEQKRLAELAMFQAGDVKNYQLSKDAATDTAAQVASIVAAAAVTIISGGTAGPVMIAFVMGVTELVTKIAMKGASYSDEDLLIDVVKTAGSVVAAWAGPAAAEAKAFQSFLKVVGEMGGAAGPILQGVFKEALTMGIQSGIGGLLDGLLDADAARDFGDWIKNVGEKTAMGILSGIANGAVMGGIGGALAPPRGMTDALWKRMLKSAVKMAAGNVAGAAVGPGAFSGSGDDIAGRFGKSAASGAIMGGVTGVGEHIKDRAEHAAQATKETGRTGGEETNDGPSGGKAPDAASAPAATTSGENGSAPEGGAPSEKSSTPEVATPSNKSNAPEISTPSNKGNAPEISTPGETGNAPETGTPGDNGSTPVTPDEKASVPAAATVPEPSAGSNKPEPARGAAGDPPQLRLAGPGVPPEQTQIPGTRLGGGLPGLESAPLSPNDQQHIKNLLAEAPNAGLSGSPNPLPGADPIDLVLADNVRAKLVAQDCVAHLEVQPGEHAIVGSRNFADCVAVSFRGSGEGNVVGIAHFSCDGSQLENMTKFLEKLPPAPMKWDVVITMSTISDVNERGTDGRRGLDELISKRPANVTLSGTPLKESGHQNVYTTPQGVIVERFPGGKQTHIGDLTFYPFPGQAPMPQGEMASTVATHPPDPSPSGAASAPSSEAPPSSAARAQGSTNHSDAPAAPGGDGPANKSGPDVPPLRLGGPGVPPEHTQIPGTRLGGEPNVDGPQEGGARGPLDGGGGPLATTSPGEPEQPVRVIRQDNDFAAQENSRGVPKSHIDASGNLVPADPGGTTSPLEHVYGSSPAKDHSPYTSLMTETGGVAKSYGAQEVEIDVARLRMDIAAGRLEGVEIITPNELQQQIRGDIERLRPGFDTDAALANGPGAIKDYLRGLPGLSRSATDKLSRRLLALANTTRDGEWLVRGTIPKEYMIGPGPARGNAGTPPPAPQTSPMSPLLPPTSEEP